MRRPPGTRKYPAFPAGCKHTHTPSLFDQTDSVFTPRETHAAIFLIFNRRKTGKFQRGARKI